MKTCFIFGALPVSFPVITPGEDDIVIAADKGYETARKLGFTPDLTVGDFDSLGFVPNEEKLIRLNVRKDDTDIGHAVNTALEKGFTQFAVYGGCGGKLDHTAANIQLAAHIAQNGGRAVFFGESESFTVVKNGKISFGTLHTGRISVFSLSEKSTGVTEIGLDYSLDKAVLINTVPLGVSNSFTGKPAEISVEDGTLLIIWQGHLPPE